MQRNTLWSLAAVATVAGALATLPTTAVTAGTAILGPAQRCYPASALKGATGNLPVHLVGSDGFGPFNVTLSKAKSVCLPADLSGSNGTVFIGGASVCFATKDVERPSFPTGVVVNLTVPDVGTLGLKLRKSKLTCLPLDPFGT